MRNLLNLAARALLRIVAIGAALDAAILLSWLLWQVPGCDAVVVAVWSLGIASWLWYRATVVRESYGGHLWWPGRIEDRWRQ